ncbi:restriction endonuclease subunit S [Rahnella sp. AN3-3W3]|uniref:restriction endonuclease subunit S n=1 Tax=Rahnella sp. AN3-3W3 TaxID=1610578 RepID=UPI000DD3CCEF|nr:restriction endonuclease subunit S [Rahnella sp. AN3-3W3]
MSGRYKAYGEYKESGVEWVGSMPSHWTIEPLFSNCDAPIEKNSDGREKNVLSLSYGNIIPRDVDDNFGLLPESFNTYQLVYPQNIILRLTDLQNDKRSLRVGFSKQQGIITSAYLKLVFTKKMSSPFMYRLLHSYDTTKVFYGMGGGLRQSMKFEDFRRLPLLIPSFAEQTQIATFLDHETAKIDTLIDKQQQLIELLKEKRQAVISHAVTKGLDPDVPMKDSGVEWLGEVPEHWKVLAIKKIVSTPITDGPHETPNFIDEGISFISAEAISSGVIDFSKQRACISIKDHIRFSEKYKPHLYDIYMVKSGATTGVSAIVETINDFNIWSPLAALRCSEIAFPYFVLYFLRSQQFLTAIELNWSFGTQQNIGMGVIGNIYISCPPIKEAMIISDHIRQKCSKIESLITLATHQISLMQERRTALISAAVTGKIDVRDWQVPVTQTESDEVMA